MKKKKTKLNYQIQAMEFMFGLIKSSTDGELSINDFVDIIRKSVASGSGMLAITLEMAASAAWVIAREQGEAN